MKSKTGEHYTSLCLDFSCFMSFLYKMFSENTILLIIEVDGGWDPKRFADFAQNIFR